LFIKGDVEMLEVSTNDGLKRALLHNEDEIHVINKKLSQEILERSKTYRFIFYVMQLKGYKIIKLKPFGAFDIKFVKDRNNY
jgi:hypothetical protein